MIEHATKEYKIGGRDIVVSVERDDQGYYVDYLIESESPMSPLEVATALQMIWQGICENEGMPVKIVHSRVAETEGVH